MKKLVYDVIKYFAEKNTEKFQTSNLIELTDNVVFKMRGEIEFPKEKKNQQNLSKSSMSASGSAKRSSVGFTSHS